MNPAVGGDDVADLVDAERVRRIFKGLLHLTLRSMMLVSPGGIRKHRGKGIKTHLLEETEITAVGVGAAVTVEGSELDELVRGAVDLVAVALQDFDGLVLRASDFRLRERRAPEGAGSLRRMQGVPPSSCSAACSPGA